MADVTKRVKYFDRQFLRAADFQDGQAYDLDRRWRHNRLLHAPGIAEGLQVTANINDAFVTVAAGTAYDGLGREIVLAGSQQVNLPTTGATAYITIAYGEQPTDASTDPGVTGNTRIMEQPALLAAATPPATPSLTLATVALASGKVSAAPDNTVRNQAGTVLGQDLTIHSVTLRNDAVSPSTWPKLVCSAANTAAVQNAGLTINGKLGVGTTTPDRNVTVQGIGATYLNVKDSGGPFEILLGVDASGGILSTVTNHDLQLRSGINKTHVIVKADGKVGIGTTTPGYLLDVDGPIRLRGTGSMPFGTPAGLWLYQAPNQTTPGKDQAYIGMSSDEIVGLFAATSFLANSLMMNTTTGNVGVGIQPAPAGGARLDVAGVVHASSFLSSSDARFKTNVTPIGDALEKIEGIRGVAFDWNKMYESLGRSTARREIGVIAQDVEKVCPELVSTWHKKGYKAVDYGRLTALLVEAIKELKARNENLERRIDALEKSRGLPQKGNAPPAAVQRSRSKTGKRGVS